MSTLLILSNFHYKHTKRQTASVYHNSSILLDTRDSRSWNRNQADSDANPRLSHTVILNAYVSLGQAVRVFANSPGDLGSIPGRVIPKTQKMVLDASLLNTQHYKVRIKGKVKQSRVGVAPSPTPWCSSYRKGSLRVTLD